MKTAAITMVRDEDDVIEATVRHIAKQVDLVYVADNGSVDGTHEILRMLSGELGVAVINDPEPAYFQSRKMTELAHRAFRHGAQWVVPFDADELWYSPLGRVGDVLGSVRDDFRVVCAEVYDHVATAADDLSILDPTVRMEWRRVDRLSLPKVAVRRDRGLVIHQGNHGADYGGEIEERGLEGVLSVRHFPYRSADQFVRKVRNGSAAYRATGHDLPLTTGQHWREWGALLDTQGEDAVRAIYWQWYWNPDPAVKHDELPDLVKDPAPLWT